MASAPNFRNYREELETLIPKPSEKLDEDQQKDKIQQLLNKVFTHCENFDATQVKDLKKIYEITEQATQIGLVSGATKDKAQEIFSRTLQSLKPDFKITTNDGEIFTVNSELLKQNSSAFKQRIESGMRETREGIVLNRYSKATIELLMRYLKAPSASAIPLPSNNDQVLEFIQFALEYKFDDLLHQLDPMVTAYLQEQFTSNTENAGVWLEVLPEYNEEIPLKWIASITPQLLENWDIPVKPSFSPRKFEISPENIHLFSGDTSLLFQRMPLFVNIKTREDLVHFLVKCKEITSDEKSYINIEILVSYNLTPEEKSLIDELAKTHHVRVNIVKPIILPNVTIFGPDKWEKYFGSVGAIPSLPDNIGEILMRPHPHLPGKLIKDTHMLVLIPKTINGKPLTLNRLKTLLQTPKEGHMTKILNAYDEITLQLINQLGDQEVKEAHWVLMTKGILEDEDALRDSKRKSYIEQQSLVAQLAAETQIAYEVPNLLDAIVCIATHYVDLGEYLFSFLVYIRCQENMRVGAFDAAGLHIYGCDPNFKHSAIGMAALCKFF